MLPTNMGLQMYLEVPKNIFKTFEAILFFMHLWLSRDEKLKTLNILKDYKSVC